MVLNKLSSRPLLAADLLRPIPAVKVGMISLGCAKNLVDAEIMLGDMRGARDGSNGRCRRGGCPSSSIPAPLSIPQRRSRLRRYWKPIKQRGLRKRPGPEARRQRVHVAEIFGELASEIPEVDAFMGLDQVARGR